MRVVHYLNQFFGGQGGEEAADMAPRIQDGAVGPGRLLEQVLGKDTHIVHTIIAGDNYAAENLEMLTELVVRHVKAAQAELFVAGPCFEAGRYGVVCFLPVANDEAGTAHYKKGMKAEFTVQ